MRTRFLPLGLACFLSVQPALAQTPVPLTVSGNEARGRVSLPGGFELDLTITFESVVGLTPSALDVTASLVPQLDTGFLARLPGLGAVTLPAALPVLLSIEPSAGSALAFQGIANVELHTHNLTLTTNSPLALYCGPSGGPLEDITRYLAMGSTRAGGSKGGFSDFVIVSDLRPIDTVVTEKFDALQDLLDDHGGSIEPSVLSVLQTKLTEALAAYGAGDPRGAIAKLEAFSAEVAAASGSSIPNVWRAHDTHVNVAGLLRSQAGTLVFSLGKKAAQSP